ncbi:DUF423 domain-containing protein [Zunongwangia sp. F363]|uniref:DUF423 domain-containing protein n=1 Tax=Autumnicola tepida TaxID=3075595 RepID=A0ABU3CAZ9_9FLAO|nr:DUF423 domain-containing protein [Zunongwangia sp. F363]MDT0643438.1 DUF423 domain-containing protein [Zunongwangia sp. F363]
MNKKFLIAGAIFGFLGVITGAFAAHGLRPLITAESFQSFETGVKYQMYHALFLLILGLKPFLSPKLLGIVFYLLIFGVLFFSGSIYLLATNNLSGFDFRSIALITPLGGMLLIIAWLLTLISAIKLKKK